MLKSHKTIAFSIVALIGLLAAIALLFFLGVNVFKPRVEAAASAALGMEVRVGGRVGIGFFPSLLVTLEDVHVRNLKADVATAKEARVGIDFLPLLKREIRIEKIVLEHPRISIERDRNGRFNFEKPERSGGTLPALNLAKISLSDGTFLYADKESGEGFEAGDCNLNVSGLQLSGEEQTGIMKNLAFAAELACGEIRTKDYAVSGLKISVTGKNGVFDLRPSTKQVFGGQGAGNIQADYTGAVPLYHVRYSLSRFQIGEFLKALSPQNPQNVAEGAMDFYANLSMQGKTVNELRQTAEGQITLRGKNLTLNGRDLDREFARYESSQHFNLVDVGAYFLVGPFGLIVTKGYNFARIYQGSGGRSKIRTLVSDWKVEHGVARAQDVAMATNENRVALKGALDLVNDRFDDVTLALIDAKGCAKVRQQIRGTFQKPVVEQPSTVKSLAGPVRKLLKQVRNLFPGGECVVFYAGSVASPK